MRRLVLALTAAFLCAGCATWISSAIGAAPTGQPAGGSVTPAASGALPPGPVTLITLGDSLTAGQGDDTGVGFTGRLAETIAATPGREGSRLVNLGQSGWDSTMLVEGGDGAEGQLPQAVQAARAAAGTPVLATVLIGSNDLWYVYQNSTEDPAPAADEDAALATYRTNLDQTVRELQEAGAVVVVGLPDDQSLRPISKDPTLLADVLPNITTEEVARMSALSQQFAQVAQEVAVARGAGVVATDAPFWADPSFMAADGGHPNEQGYAALAALWEPAVTPLLG